MRTKQQTRITLDISDTFHQQIKVYTAKRGITLKEFFLDLAAQKLSQNKSKTKKLITLPLNTNKVDINKIIEDAWQPKF